MTNLAVSNNLINVKTLGVLHTHTHTHVIAKQIKNKITTTNQNLNDFGVWLFCVVKNKGHPVCTDTG